MEPYTITDALQRFNQRYTAFARARWDDSCPLYAQQGKPVDEILEAGRPGYGREDLALQNGAWAVARSRLDTPQATAPGGAGTAESASGDRHRPGDLRAFTRQVKQAASEVGWAP